MFLLKNKLYIILKMLIYKLLKVRVELYLEIKESMLKEMHNSDLLILPLSITIQIDHKVETIILVMLIREHQEYFQLHLLTHSTKLIRLMLLLRSIEILIQLKQSIQVIIRQEITLLQVMFMLILLSNVCKIQKDRLI